MDQKDATMTAAGKIAGAPSVAMILVNWNGLSDTLACLRSIEKITYQNHSVVVVDNGSKADEAAAVRAAFPDVTVLETGRNLGFTGGNNVGIRHALRESADYLLCLNNDTTVAPDFLSHLVDALESRPDAGVAASTILFADRPELISEQGLWVDLSRMWPTGHIHENERLNSSFATDDVIEVPGVSGCVLLMRRAAAEAVKGFDLRYFAYSEDVDLCLRARAVGWKCIAVPQSLVWHKVSSASGGENSPTAVYYSTRNVYRFVMRHGTPKERASFRHQFRDYWLTDWEHLVQAATSDPRVWEDVGRVERVRDKMVICFMGQLYCSGHRESCSLIEWGLRALMNARIRLAMFENRHLMPYCARLYWKLHALSPRLASFAPKPPLIRIARSQERRLARGRWLISQAQAAQRVIQAQVPSLKKARHENRY